jgi:hypothetical protein
MVPVYILGVGLLELHCNPLSFEAVTRGEGHVNSFWLAEEKIISRILSFKCLTRNLMYGIEKFDNYNNIMSLIF